MSDKKTKPDIDDLKGHEGALLSAFCEAGTPVGDALRLVAALAADHIRWLTPEGECTVEGDMIEEILNEIADTTVPLDQPKRAEDVVLIERTKALAIVKKATERACLKGNWEGHAMTAVSEMFDGK